MVLMDTYAYIYIYILDFNKVLCLSYVSTLQRNNGEKMENYISYAIRDMGKYMRTTD